MALFQAMVTRFPIISTRKLTKSVKILTHDKSIVGVSDYNEFYKTAKRHMLTHILGPNAQVCDPAKNFKFNFVLQLNHRVFDIINF